MPSGVHDSALIVNAYRARQFPLSGDPYATLWVTKESEIWADEYAEKVGQTEILVHALRHRFFLKSLQQFLHKNPDGVFINIGAGFTNYPYLIDANIPCCEVDREVNVFFKQHKLAEFEQSVQLPKRNIHFLITDNLNNLESISHLALSLKEWVNHRPSFVLFEGVFFYLTFEAIKHFFKALVTLQQSGDRIGITCFRPEECNKLMFQRLVNYCHRDYQMRNFVPTTIAPQFYQQLDNYHLLQHHNYYQLADQYQSSETLSNPDEVLEEDVYLLEKI